MIAVCHFCGSFHYAAPENGTLDQIAWAKQAAVFDHLALLTHRGMVDLATELESAVYAPLRPDERRPRS